IRIEQHAIAVSKGEDRIEMHRGAQLGHGGDDDAFRRAIFKKRQRHLVIACRDVRSLMPMSTLPLPISITSPPSKVASPWSASGSPHQTFTLPAKSGWNL